MIFVYLQKKESKMQTLNTHTSLKQHTDELQQIIAILSGSTLYGKFLDSISKISTYAARLLYSFILKKELTKMLILLENNLAELKQYPELATSQNLYFCMENIKTIKFMCELVQKRMKGTPFYNNTLALCQNLLETEQAVESFIIEESFKDNTPLSGFGQAFNDWNDEKEGVWQGYL